MFRKIIRKASWDYRWTGVYFITICTKDRIPYFGHIDKRGMHISPMGIIADLLMFEIQFHHNVTLIHYCVMPNHIHTLFHIDYPNTTIEISKLDSKNLPGMNRFPLKGKNSVSSIIGSYKASVTRQCHKFNFAFAWQTRFYDEIIVDEAHYNNVHNYISTNVEKWVERNCT